MQTKVTRSGSVFQVAGVGALHDHTRAGPGAVSSRVGRSRRQSHRLASRPALQQDIGEAAGAGADVRADSPVDVQIKCGQRPRELEAAATYVGHRRGKRNCGA